MFPQSAIARSIDFPLRPSLWKRELHFSQLIKTFSQFLQHRHSRHADSEDRKPAAGSRIQTLFDAIEPGCPLATERKNTPKCLKKSTILAQTSTRQD